jgi:hypothetical protein
MSVAALGAFAQGSVNFLNNTATLSSPPDRFLRFARGATPGNAYGTNNALAHGTNILVQLYYGASSITDSNSPLLIAVTTAPATLRTSTSTAVGTWAGGGGRTLQGFDYGSGQVALEVRAWDANTGATYDLATVKGESRVFLYTLPSSAGSPPTDFYMVNFLGFSIDQVPEPTTFALAGLGFAGLMIFRRRK